MNEKTLTQQPLKITHRPQPKRRYVDVGIGIISLAGADDLTSRPPYSRAFHSLPFHLAFFLQTGMNRSYSAF